MKRASLFMEIPRLNTEVLHMMGLGAGLGSNDIGLDRGGFQGSRIVTFERNGPRVMMVQPNYDYRSSSTNPAEVKAVRDAFARSILWGFQVAAESDGGRRVLVDLTDFLLGSRRDRHAAVTKKLILPDIEPEDLNLPRTMTGWRKTPIRKREVEDVKVEVDA